MVQAEPRCHQSMGSLTIWSQKYSLLQLNLIIPGFPFRRGKSLILAEAENINYRDSVGRMTPLVTQELFSMVAAPGLDFFFFNQLHLTNSSRKKILIKKKFAGLTS